MAPLLQMRGISKAYPGVQALNDVDFDLNAGEVHVLLGENGAGKSTLIKILSGAVQPDQGAITLNHEDIIIQSPSQARQLGISTIYQEFNLVPELTVGQNIFLGREPRRAGLLRLLIDWKQMYDQSREIISSLGIHLDPREPIGRLGIAQRQMVEIAKALSQESRILILDEPTASLTDREIEILFAIITKLKQQGVGIIYISHRLAEVKLIGDRVTVLRDGQWIGTKDVTGASIPEMIAMMIGRQLEKQFPRDFVVPGEEILRIEGVGNIPLVVRRGELVGVAGLVGAGRTELAEAMFGLRQVPGLKVYLAGKMQHLRNSGRAKRAGVALLPEDRRLQGLALSLPILENVAHPNLDRLFPSWILSPSKEKELALEYTQKLDVVAPSVDVPVGTLSGGNQQKVVLAKWLPTKADLLIFDEPTRGVDVGSKAEIHSFMNELVQGGAAIMMISSDLPEILGMSDRIYVMREGSVVAELGGEEATQQTILAFALGEE